MSQRQPDSFASPGRHIATFCRQACLHGSAICGRLSQVVGGWLQPECSLHEALSGARAARLVEAPQRKGNCEGRGGRLLTCSLAHSRASEEG